MRLRAGIDIGTSGVKVALVDDEGGTTIGRAPLVWDEADGRTQVPAERIETSVRSALDDALARRPGTIVSVGVASLAESAILLDERREPLVPVVAWHDPRGEAEARLLADAIPQERFAALTGLPISALCTAVKLRALAVAGLDVARVSTVLPVADWIAFRLTGTRAVDLTLASRTGLLDLGGRRWASEVVGWTGLPADALPPLREPGADRGPVVEGPAAGARCFVAGMDHLVAALGAGATAPGDTWNSCGTAEAILTATHPLGGEQLGAAVARGLTVGWHAAPGRQVLVAAQRSGFDYGRVLRVLGVEDAAALSELEAETGGTRLPVWTAMVEHVAAQADELFAHVDATVGAVGLVGETVVGGGWARSSVVREAKLRHRDRVRFCDVDEPGAVGAACWAELVGVSSDPG